MSDTNQQSVLDDFALARRGIQGFRDPLNPSAALNALQRIEEQYEDAVQTAKMHEDECAECERESRHLMANWTASQDALGRMKEKLQALEDNRTTWVYRAKKFEEQLEAAQERLTAYETPGWINSVQKVMEERRRAERAEEQLEAAQAALYANGHRPPGTPSFHMDGCTGCDALAGVSFPASRPDVSEGTQKRSSHVSSVGRGMVRDAKGSVPSETFDRASRPSQYEGQPLPHSIACRCSVCSPAKRQGE